LTARRAANVAAAERLFPAAPDSTGTHGPATGRHEIPELPDDI
jgi:hypothetical protein